MSAKPSTSLNERTKHSSSIFMVSVSVPSMSNMTRCMGSGLTRHKISYRACQRASLQVEGCSCIAWLGRFGTRGERYDVSLFQITLQAFELLVIPDFRHVCDAAP